MLPARVLGELDRQICCDTKPIHFCRRDRRSIMMILLGYFLIAAAAGIAASAAVGFFLADLIMDHLKKADQSGRTGYSHE
jgi:hypothetical protein